MAFPVSVTLQTVNELWVMPEEQFVFVFFGRFKGNASLLTRGVSR
jgi:hypothetical protein